MTAIARLEHVNITSSDGSRLADLLATLCGWHRRWEGPSMMGGYSIHLGSDDAYVAIYTPADGVEGQFRKSVPLNHIGIEVDDLDRAEAVIEQAGLTPFNHDDYEPGRRFYFFDWDGIEWEVISYR